MIFWSDMPVEQWIYVIYEDYSLHPWAVIVGGYVRAKCTTEDEADRICMLMRDTFVGCVTPARKSRA